ncbi:MAG: choice-of-anchor Q domain-containing protein, partial [Candidatus Cloacimonetes bacterium]|nr:choice-of-anchor Q domain-containing protein [Candidatus Cloacimonadota bacterium]
MKLSILALLMLIVTSMVHAATISVALDGSQAYTSIQSAIEVADNSDTVLVYPGRYYENIDYIGKSITVCSLEATTNDSTYINSTIIDGNQNGSCVVFRNHEQNATLRGFTITNGIGYPIWDGLRRGGGILIYTNSTVALANCTISSNHAAIGGGIFAFCNNMTISGLNIFNNYAVVQGGGMALNGASTHYPTIVFDPVNRCSIYSNYGANPVDILVTDIRANLEINLDMFTISTPDRFYVARHSNLPVFEQYTDTVNIQRAYRTEVNHDLYVSPNGDDSNSGLNSSQAMKSITRAIHRIAADSLNVKTVHVLPGTYSEGINDQILPIPLKSNINIIGAGSDFTTISSNIAPFTSLTQFFGGDRCTNILLKGFRIISGISEGNRALGMGNLTRNTIISDIVTEDMVVQNWGAICLDYLEFSTFDSLIIRNITTPESAFEIIAAYSGSIRNSIFENIHSTYTSPDTPGDDSWGTTVVNIWVEDSLTVENCTFRNISVQNNQNTFHISNNYISTENIVNVNVNNCLFENIRSNAGAPIVFGNNRYGDYKVSNCTFYENYGQGAAVGIGGKVEMRNNIFYNPDTPHELFLYNASPQSNIIGNLNFDYNNIRGGSSNIHNPDLLNTLIYGEHNLASEPLFASTTLGNPEYLHLASGSPCINAGTPDVSALQLLPFDLAGNWRIWNNRIDMGCYEYGSVPWVDNEIGRA